MLPQFDPAILHAVGRASKRSSGMFYEDMRDGVYDLATIASIAPWIGVLGTILGIVSSFHPCIGRRSTCMGALAGGLSEAMWFTALGILVGLIASWAFEYLTSELRGLDREMENASLELLNQLSRFPRPFAIGPASEPIPKPMFGQLPLEDVQREDRFFSRCLKLAGVALAFEWFVQATRFVPDYGSSYSLSSAILYGCFYVPITFAVCCLFVYPFWAKFLHHRRPGALVASGSVLCLCWSVAELLLARPLP